MRTKSVAGGSISFLRGDCRSSQCSGSERFPHSYMYEHVFLRWLLLSWAGLGYFDFHFLAVCEAAHHGRRACWYKCYDKSKTPLGTDRGSVGLAKNQDSIEPSERHMRIG